ncbi:MAG: hypothetical protein JWO09_2787 [Bacteroidetes bacterium]|nr:hypothetical protein [Bacteroidota bacterium]
MAIESRNKLKTFFETGDIPTQEEFWDVIDSYVHQQDDGILIVDSPEKEKYFGIGKIKAASRLGVQAGGRDNTLVSFHDKKGQPVCYFSFPSQKEEQTGFSIDEGSARGLLSRFLIQKGTGNIGIGTVFPTQKLDIQSLTSAGVTGLKIQNLATLKNQGWILGQTASGDNSDGALSLYENDTRESGGRMTFLVGGNVGINESLPDTTFQVSRSVNDPKTDLDLISGTGIVVIGPITSNIVADYRGMQARKGEYIGTQLSLETDTFNLQRLGGDILFHGDDSVNASFKGIITDDGKLGLGTVTPQERVDIAGAIKIGSTTGENEGTIRFTGTDFEGYKSGAWVSLTAGNGPWTHPAGNTVYYSSGSTSRVGIGTNTVNATLSVLDTETVTQGNTAALIRNNSQTNSSGLDDNRVGIQVDCSGTWGGDPKSKNVGLYVAQVAGQTNSASNIAAVMNGNVVIGGMVSGKQLLGTSSSNVLSIQNGVKPDGIAETDSVQLYSDMLNNIPTLHIMRGNADTIKLYKETALTAADAATVSDSYTAVEKAVIVNLRTRLNQLEAKLISMGLLTAPV